MAYLLLFFAIIAEVAGTSLLKSTEGFSRLWPTVACLIAYFAAFFLLAAAVERGMNVGVGYALWAGLGTTAIVVVSALFLGESVTASTVIGVGLIIAGVVVLNLTGAQH